MRTLAEEGRTRGAWIELLREGDREAWQRFCRATRLFSSACFGASASTWAAAECQRLAQEDWREQKLADVLRLVQARAPANKWEVFRRRWLERQSVAQIARTLDLSAATVLVYTSQILALCKQEAKKINLEW